MTNAKAQPLSKSAKRKARKQARQQQQASSPAHVGAAKAKQRVERVFDHFVSEGALLARQMALPESVSAPIRLPTADMPRTAIVKSTETFTVETPSVEFSNIDSSDHGQLMSLALGRPGCSMMYGPTVPQTKDTAHGTTYRSFSFMHKTGGTIDGGFEAFQYLSKSSSIMVDFRPVKDVCEGEPLPLAYSRGKTYFWMDAGCSLKLTCGGSKVDFSIQYTWLRYMGSGEEDALAGNFTLAAGDTVLNTGATSNPTLGSGWYRIQFEFTNPSSTDDITGSGVRLLIPSVVFGTGDSIPGLKIGVFRFSCPDVTKDATIGAMCRRTACSVLMTNTSAEILKQGTIVAGRALFDDYGPQKAGTTFNSFDVGRLANKYTGQSAKGVYTYMDFDRGCESFEQACNEFLHPTIQLDNILYMHAMLITGPRNSTDMNQFLVTVNTHYEFLTDSMKYSTNVPLGQFQALIEARRINNATAYFYENPLHPGDIWRFIKSSFNALRRTAVPIGMAASALFPEAAGTIMPLAHALQI